MDGLPVSQLRLASAALKAAGAALQRAVTSPFKGENGASTYYKDIAFAAVRTHLGSLDVAHDRHLNGASTTDNYNKYAKKHKFEPNSITLPSGTQAHWLGSSSAARTLVYFHGGGYVLPCGPGHILWLDDVQKSLGPDFSILLLAYSVAPEARYPTQLQQAVELLHHLVHTQDRNPSHLILGGDSAGGNLVLAVLSHLAHPHADITPLSLPARFHGALLISPWCCLTRTDTPAFIQNAQRDILSPPVLSRWATAFLGSDAPFSGDEHSEPVVARSDWWEPVADFVEEVLIWIGDNEVLRDGIEEWAARFSRGFRNGGGRVSTVNTPKAAHEEMILERVVGYKGDSGTGSQQIVENWVRSRL